MIERENELPHCTANYTSSRVRSALYASVPGLWSRSPKVMQYPMADPINAGIKATLVW